MIIGVCQIMRDLKEVIQVAAIIYTCHIMGDSAQEQQNGH